MTLGDPGEIWFDSATLLSLAFADAALAALQAGALGGRPRWAEAVEDELDRLATANPPPPRVNNVRRDARWLGEPVVPDEQQHAEVERRRGAVAIPDEHDDEHLGETQSVVLARDSHRVRAAEAGGGPVTTVVASDDRGTATVLRGALAGEKVRMWTTAHLLAYLVQRGVLACDDAYRDYQRMIGTGQRRGFSQQLTEDELCAGDIPAPRP